MAIITTPRLHRDERGLAQQYERRSPQEGTSASPTASPSAAPTQGPEVIRLSTSTKSLAIVIAVLGTIVLGIAVWRLVAWRRRRRTAPSTLQNNRSFEKAFTPFPPSKEGKAGDLEAYVQQPQKAVLFPAVPRASAGVNWVPQVKPTIYVPYESKSADDSSDDESEEMTEKSLSQMVVLTKSQNVSPPPSYGSEKGRKIQSSFTRSMPPPPPAPRDNKSTSIPPTPPTPPASFKLKVESSRSSIPPPEPSPRSASFGAQICKTKSLSKTLSRSSRSHAKANKLPRLMHVVTTFQPSMEDELSVQLGETLRLLEEYEDEWCLVQRVGRYDAEKGVIPRFCLVERPTVVVPSTQKQAMRTPTSFAS